MAQERKVKTPLDSTAEQVQVLTLSSMNGTNRLFGGRLMEWIDIVAAVVARRHSERNVTTAAVERLEFREPAVPNSTVVLKGKIVYAGNTSMVVRVHSYVEALDGACKLINSAYLTMVALDEDDHPTQVPELRPQTDEEREEWAHAKSLRARQDRK
ncbi:MAG: hotdog domain-containing protein [Clostridiaceae bacterium]|nr:hotdog domain-containing protein [Clostridiaceae bacterium]